MQKWGKKRKRDSKQKWVRYWDTHFQRGCIILRLSTGTGGRASNFSPGFPLLLSFIGWSLSHLLPSNVAWALWAATGEPGPRRVQSCWGKGELLPPLQSVLFLRTPRSVVAKVVKTGPIAYHNNALSNAHRRGT